MSMYRYFFFNIARNQLTMLECDQKKKTERATNTFAMIAFQICFSTCAGFSVHTICTNKLYRKRGEEARKMANTPN